MLDKITSAIGNALGDIGGFVSSGIASFFEWLFGGILAILGKVIEAFQGIFAVFDAIFEFGFTFLESIAGLLGTFLPFVPEGVLIAFECALIAVLIAGIYRKVRGN